MNRAKILVIDDDPGVVEDLVDLLRRHGHDAEGTCDPAAVLEACGAAPPDLVVSDVVMEPMRGDELMRRIHAAHPDQLVLLMTAFGSIDQGVAAIRAGACDFVAKPFAPEALIEKVERAVEGRLVVRGLVRLSTRPPLDAGEIIYRSEAMRRVVSDATRAAESDVSVLITGESGVGKGLLAAAIHRWSGRRSGPFVNLNCAALPTSLAEAELFGVRRGAFTDARSDREGLFVRASGGTLFLDEVGEIPLELQPKLLQVLESRYVRPLGGADEVAIDTRLVAATNADLEQAVSQGSFRPDLYHRLDVLRIEIPPLRERPEDIPPLVDHLLPRLAARIGRPINGVSAEVLAQLQRAPWPGNVRELSNALERGIALARHDVLLPEDIRSGPHSAAREDSLAFLAHRGASLAEVEAAYVHRVLESCGYNKVESARVLGIDRRTLHRKLAREGLPEDPSGSASGSSPPLT